MFEFTRTADYISVKLKDETLKVYLGDFAFYKELVKIQKALDEAQKSKDDEKYEKVLGRLLDIVFGGENLSKIAEFYGANKIEMITQCFQFIKIEYMPKLIKSIEDTSKKLAGIDDLG